MFELALFDYLKTQTINGDTINWGYGEVPDGSDAPYITQFNLDSSRDRQVICDDFEDGGVAFIQWNIYDINTSVSDRIAFGLEEILDGLWDNETSLTYLGNSYTITLREHNSSPSAQVIENDLSTSVLTNTFTYRKD